MTRLIQLVKVVNQVAVYMDIHNELDFQPPKIDSDQHMNDPNISGELLDSIGKGGGVNCYPGSPGSCHAEAYIFVDYVTNPWGCLDSQMTACTETVAVIFVGSHYALNYHSITGKNGRPTPNTRHKINLLRYGGKILDVISYRDGLVTRK